MMDILSINILIYFYAVPTARLYAISFSERMPLLSLTGDFNRLPAEKSCYCIFAALQKHPLY